MQVADVIGAKIRDAINGALSDSKSLLIDVVKQTPAGTGGTGGGGGGLFDDVKDLASLLSSLTGIFANVISVAEGAAQEVAAQAGRFGTGLGFGYLLGSILWEAAKPGLEPIFHAAADAAQTEIHDPQTAAQLVAKQIITNAFGASEAAGGNLNGAHFSQLVDAASTRPDLGTTLELFRRGEITSGMLAESIARSSVPANWYTPLETLSRVLLSPADLALANLRGFLADGDMYAYAQQLGLINSDMDTLVANTGEPPGLMQLLEAYRRGIIDQPTLEHGIRQSRVRNEWIPTVEQLRYSPMSVSDATRGVVENYLSDAEGQAIAEENGLKPEHWRPLVDSWGRPLAHEQMILLYLRGQASLDQVHQAIRESDVKNKYIDQAVELGRRLIPERTIVSAIRNGALSPAEGAKRLLELGFNQADTAVLINLGNAEHHSNAKALSRAQVIQLYEQQLLTKPQAVEHLVKLGYSQADAGLSLSLADRTAAHRQLLAEEAHIKSLFNSEHITQDEAVRELRELGVDAGAADELIARWRRQRQRPGRTLTESQIVKAATEKAITPRQALSMLQADGYTEADGEIILKSHGIDLA